MTVRSHAALEIEREKPPRVREVPGLGPRQHGLGRRAAGGPQRDAAPGVVEHHPDARRARASCTRSPAATTTTLAMAKLREFGLADYFLYPQINWNPKSDSITEIAAATQPRPGRLRLRRRPAVRARGGGLRAPRGDLPRRRRLADAPARAGFSPRFITDESRAAPRACTRADDRPRRSRARVHRDQ